jgi:hypothetical protein
MQKILMFVYKVSHLHYVLFYSVLSYVALSFYNTFNNIYLKQRKTMDEYFVLWLQIKVEFL